MLKSKSTAETKRIYIKKSMFDTHDDLEDEELEDGGSGEVVDGGLEEDDFDSSSLWLPS